MNMSKTMVGLLSAGSAILLSLSVAGTVNHFRAGSVLPKKCQEIHFGANAIAGLEKALKGVASGDDLKAGIKDVLAQRGFVLLDEEKVVCNKADKIVINAAFKDDDKVGVISVEIEIGSTSESKLEIKSAKVIKYKAPVEKKYSKKAEKKAKESK